MKTVKYVNIRDLMSKEFKELFFDLFSTVESDIDIVLYNSRNLYNLCDDMIRDLLDDDKLYLLDDFLKELNNIDDELYINLIDEN